VGVELGVALSHTRKGYSHETLSVRDTERATEGESVSPIRRGENPAILHSFARFGMLGAKELDLLHPLHDRSIYRSLQGLKASKPDADIFPYIKLCDWQERHKHQMWSTD
jgi:hypothetical protein